MFEMPAKQQKHLNAAVYPTIETVGRNPVRLVTSLPAATGKENLV